MRTQRSNYIHACQLILSLSYCDNNNTHTPPSEEDDMIEISKFNFNIINCICKQQMTNCSEIDL